MIRSHSTPKSIDAYMARFPDDIQARLRKIRATIRKAAPRAEERISYGIPAFALNGPLVYFAAFAKHISFFPTASGIRKFKKELAPYEISKGTVRFPLDQTIPFPLITRIVKFRLKDNLAKTERKK